ncbi:MAG: NUDIX hydrolase [Candidatus Roizmanbacteria bacterium]
MSAQALHPIAQIVLYRDGKFLLTKRKVEHDDDPHWDGYWQIPTGTVNFGEDIKTAVSREAREELGIDVELERTLAVTDKVDEEKGWHGVFIAFLCRQIDPRQPITINHEAYEFAWLTYDQISRLQVIPSTMDTIRFVYTNARMYELGALAVIENKGSYLITKIFAPDDHSSHGKWGFVAGVCEPNETLKQTLVRESNEETGLNIEVSRMIPFAVEQGNFKLFCYLCTLTDPEQKVHINDEASDYRWVTKSELLHMSKGDVYGDTQAIVQLL